MKALKSTCLRLAVFLLVLHGHAQGAPNAQEILAASDVVRNPSKPFGMTVSLVEYRQGKRVGDNTLNVYSKAEENGGQFRSLVRFVAPARDANKLMLKTGNNLWFYDPNNKATIRISPQQRLLGQAANGDIVTVNFAKDYSATVDAEEGIQDGEQQQRQCYKLALAAVAPDVTYHRIEVWVETQSKNPVKARFYAESGQLLKTAYYRRYSEQLGGKRPTETVIIDGLDPNWVTVMRFSDYAYRNIPEAWMQREYLARFRPE